jgi:hypothetical protein
VDIIALRLAVILREATRTPAADTPTLAALLGSVLTPAGGASAPDTAASLNQAVCDLLVVRAPPAPMEALAAWIVRYFAPASRHRLPGAAALWIRAVNLERDRKRRAKIEPVEGCPVRLTLSNRHRELVARQLRGESHRSASAIVGKLIEREYDRRSGKKQQPAASQPSLDL